MRVGLILTVALLIAGTALAQRFGYLNFEGHDEHFSTGVQRLTRVETGEPLHMALTDDKLFDNPWIYATQTGWWGLNNAEIARLREYLLRGGFLMVDDFWGPNTGEWEIFRGTMERVLPNKPISDIAAADPVMHV